jgi:WD40 repeat protein
MVAYHADQTLCAIHAVGASSLEGQAFRDAVKTVGLSAWVNSIAWTPDGSTLLAATHDARVFFWHPNEIGMATATIMLHAIASSLLAGV